jgi:hypothetical protein
VSDFSRVHRSVWNQSPSLVNQLVTHARKPKSYPGKLKPPRSLNKLRRRIGRQSSTSPTASREDISSPQTLLDAESIREANEDEDLRMEERGDDDDEGDDASRKSQLLDLENLRSSPDPLEHGDEDKNVVGKIHGVPQRTKSEADVRSVSSSSSLGEKRRRFLGIPTQSTGSLDGSSEMNVPKKVSMSPTRVRSSKVLKAPFPCKKWLRAPESEVPRVPPLPPAVLELRRRATPHRQASTASAPAKFVQTTGPRQPEGGSLSDEVRPKSANLTSALETASTDKSAWMTYTGQA